MNPSLLLGPLTPVNFEVPSGACDTHTHVFGDPGVFPYSPSRVYTPEPASIEQLQAAMQALRMDRVVIVNPSPYGTDNACTLDAIQKIGPAARGIAVIADDTPDSELDAMDRAGIRGVRINLATLGQHDPNVAHTRLQAAWGRLKPWNWHLQMFAKLPMIEQIKDTILASPLPVVFDHFAGAEAALGTSQPGFATLLQLLRSGKVYVKISAPYRCSRNGPDFADAAPIASAMIQANPERILWGSDWPHPNAVKPPGRLATEINPRFQIDDGLVLNQLALWAPDAKDRKTILVGNPARLFGY
ncbi:MAG TPA: amidohydrolase family protein [Terriglobales bacterium]|nr:amidohydrolase family protein [Terriglobales bacterium]